MKKIWLWPPVYFLRQGLTLYFDCRLAQAAACFAYCVVLTIFPVLICLSYVLGIRFGMGAVGVWICMVIDWICRIICFTVRFEKKIGFRLKQEYHKSII